MNNLLAAAFFQNWVENFKNNLGLGLFVFILGLLVVFFGIALIIVVVSVIGKILTAKKEKPKTKEFSAKESAVSESVVESDGVPEHVKVAIISAISAYYCSDSQKSNKCDFVVKKIRRI